MMPPVNMKGSDIDSHVLQIDGARGLRVAPVDRGYLIRLASIFSSRPG
jgi:hypothetical protein